MAVETVNFLEDLNASEPVGPSTTREGDDHIRNVKKALRGLIPNVPGAAAKKTVALVGTTLTPTVAAMKVLPPGADASGTLEFVAQTGTLDGAFVYIEASVPSRPIVVTHTISGTGRITLKNGASYSLDNSKKGMLLQRQGSEWKEIWRTWDRSGSAARYDVGDDDSDKLLTRAQLDARYLQLAAPATGDAVVVHKETLGVSSATWASPLLTGYTRFKVFLHDIRGTANARLSLRLAGLDENVFFTSGYDALMTGWGSGGTSTNHSTTDRIPLTLSSEVQKLYDNSAPPGSGEFDLVTNAATKSFVHGRYSYFSSLSEIRHGQFSGWHTSLTHPIKKFQLLFDTGSIQSGSVMTILGIK